MNESIVSMLEKSKQRLNWNFFVGDPRFRFDFFLKFRVPTTAKTYERLLIGSSLYSIRLMLLFQFLVLNILPY